jgi:hypothetical protein
VIVQAGAAWTAPIAPQEVRRHAAFVEEHVLPRIVERLGVAPLPTLRGDVSAPLFVGVNGFF